MNAYNLHFSWAFFTCFLGRASHPPSGGVKSYYQDRARAIQLGSAPCWGRCWKNIQRKCTWIGTWLSEGHWLTLDLKRCIIITCILAWLSTASCNRSGPWYLLPSNAGWWQICWLIRQPTRYIAWHFTASPAFYDESSMNHEWVESIW